jgi:hypothetical protein
MKKKFNVVNIIEKKSKSTSNSKRSPLLGYTIEGFAKPIPESKAKQKRKRKTKKKK